MGTRGNRRTAGRLREARHVPARAMLPVMAGVVLALLAVSPAAAHADFESSTPEDGAVLAAPPTEVSVTFTEGVDAGKSSLVLEGPGGEVGTARPDADGDETIRLDGLSLAPGVYLIRWTAGATDGHIERGTTEFTVSDPTPAPATPTPIPAPSSTTSPSPAPVQTAAPTAAATPVPSPSGDTTAPAASTGDILLPIAATLALVTIVGVLVLRRNRAH